MVESDHFIAACERFDFKHRLDQFFFENVECQEESEELWQVIRIVSVLSHGNARVKEGFSVNKECLSPNLKQDTLRAQRIVYDAVKAAGGPSKELIPAGILKTVSMALKRYLYKASCCSTFQSFCTVSVNTICFSFENKILRSQI